MTTDSPNSEWGDELCGQVLLGRYRIMRELAKGGMGVVYLARAEGAVGFVKPVVVKLILPDFCDNPEFVGMFAREAQILSHLRDPGIVDVLEFGQDGDGYVMVLEYVRGYHLGQWQKFLRKKSRVVPTSVAMLLMIDVLEALHHAHSAKHPDGTSMSIVHRDISPSNIMLDSAGRARLLDFGVARMHGGEQIYKTQVKGFRGKLSYSAPELFSGADACERSDIYACGVVLHEVLLGRNTFRGATQNATFHNVLTKLPDSIHAVREDVPEGIDDVLGRALAKELDDRFSTAADFAAALRDALPRSEREVRQEMTALWEQDFSDEMAGVLGVESLAQRDEAWRRLSDPPSGLPAQARPLGQRRSRTGRGTRRSVDYTPASASVGGAGALSVPQPAGVPQLASPGAGAAPPPMGTAQGTTPGTPAGQYVVSNSTGGNNRLVGIAGFAIAVVLAVGVFVLSRQDAVPPPPVQVVAVPAVPPQPADPSNSGAKPALDDEHTDIAEPQPADVHAPDKSTEKASRRAKRKPRPGPSAAQLTRAFRRRHAKVERCFASHAHDLKGAPKLEVEFSINARGAIQRSALHPSNVGSTPLGACILKVAQTTRFPGQGESVTFRIPVTAKRVK